MGVAIHGRGSKPHPLPRTQSPQPPRRRGQSTGGGSQRGSWEPAAEQRSGGAKQVQVTARASWAGQAAAKGLPRVLNAFGVVPSAVLTPPGSGPCLRPRLPDECGEADWRLRRFFWPGPGRVWGLGRGKLSHVGVRTVLRE